DRRRAQVVVDDPVVGHHPQWIGAVFAVPADGQLLIPRLLALRFRHADALRRIECRRGGGGRMGVWGCGCLGVGLWDRRHPYTHTPIHPYSLSTDRQCAEHTDGETNEAHAGAAISTTGLPFRSRQ